MPLTVLLLAVVLVGVVAAVAAGRISGGLAPPDPDHAGRPLPPGRLGADDLDRLTFSVGLRGYRMDEVDAALDRLRTELAARDAQPAVDDQRAGGAELPGAARKER